MEVQRDACLGTAGGRRAQCVDRQPVAEQQVMGGRGGGQVTDPRRMRPGAVAVARTTRGSFTVIQRVTRSPSASATIAAYSANRSAVPRTAQPPSSWMACGRSQ